MFQVSYSHCFTDKVISEEEQQRILTSDTFNDFLSRSSKIVERALDEDYDVLVDYTIDVEANQYGLMYCQLNSSTSDETDKIKQVVSFYSEQWSKKRSVTSLDWSPKVSSLRDCLMVVSRTFTSFVYEESFSAV